MVRYWLSYTWILKLTILIIVFNKQDQLRDTQLMGENKQIVNQLYTMFSCIIDTQLWQQIT